MRLIFLDIDGVLNTSETKQRHRGFIGMQPDLVQRFNELVRSTDAGVILSSTWRIDPNWEKTMRSCGLTCKFLGRTDRLPSGIRGEEIQEWLDKYTEPVEAYAIIDDDSDMLPHQPHFKTSFYAGGLTDEIAEAIRKHLCGC